MVLGITPAPLYSQLRKMQDSLELLQFPDAYWIITFFIMPERCTAQLISCVKKGRDINVQQTSCNSVRIAFALEKAILICLDALLANS